MTIRKILQLGNPLLRQVCEKVDFPVSSEIRCLVEDMADTVQHSFKNTGYGRAIAAPQVGETKRIVYLSVPEPTIMINPEIVEKSTETMVIWDACLSFLCIFMKVRRHCRIIVEYHDLNGSKKALDTGLRSDLAELLQHEIEHLNGILAIDKVEDSKTFCLREEFEKRHNQDN